MKRVIILAMLLFSINSFSHIGYPCSASEKKCIIHGFKVGSEELSKNEYEYIKWLVESLNGNAKESTVLLIGHTDSEEVGTKGEKNVLSEERAQEIGDLMRELGLDGSIRIITAGKGDVLPLDSNGSIEGRFRNRRVEMYMYIDEENLKSLK